MFAAVPVCAVFLVSSTVALDLCDDSIISKLSECYSNGVPPQQMSSGLLGTHIWISEGELPSNTRCVTAKQNHTAADVQLYFTDNTSYNYTYAHEYYEKYILESDSTGKIKYRLYVVHNSNGAYSYYRCIQEGVAGTGSPMGDIAVTCGKYNDADTVAGVKEAKTCLEKLLGITNLIELQPCDCKV